MSLALRRQVALLANQQVTAKLLAECGGEAAISDGSGAALCDVASNGEVHAVKALLQSKVGARPRPPSRPPGARRRRLGVTNQPTPKIPSHSRYATWQ